MKTTQKNVNESELQEKSRLKILIVEDDFASGEVLVEYLSEYGDCAVVVNGVDAVTTFKDALDEGRPYDMVCLDIMIPAINGHLVLKEICRMEREYGIDDHAGIKIIMTTAVDDTKDIVSAFKEGCDAYIVKPVTREHLVEEMRKFGLIK